VNNKALDALLAQAGGACREVVSRIDENADLLPRLDKEFPRHHPQVVGDNRRRDHQDSDQTE